MSCEYAAHTSSINFFPEKFLLFLIFAYYAVMESYALKRRTPISVKIVTS